MTAPTTPTTLPIFEVTGSWISISAPFISGNVSDPHIEPVQGLATFTPRVPKGMSFFVNDHLVTDAYNTLQQVFLIGNPTSGTFRLSLDAASTQQLAYNASAATVRSALEGLPTVGTGNVAVSVTAPDSYDIEFKGALAETAVVPLISYSNLSNALLQPCPISVTIVNQGTPQVIADTAVVLPAITARIWKGRLCAIDSVDSPGVKLAANGPALNMKDPLIYDVNFSKVSYNAMNQVLAPFGFVAPPVETSVCLTDPQFQKVPYAPPIQSLWTPSSTAAQSKNWRLRAV